MNLFKSLSLILTLEISFGFSGHFAFAENYKDYLLKQSNQTFFKYDDVKCDDPTSPKCYRQTFCKIREIYGGGNLSFIKIAPQNNSVNCIDEEVYDNFYEGFTVKAYSNVTLRSSKKTPLVVVSIHGLWGNTKQFERTLEMIRSANRGDGLNYIELTLPGHLKTYAGRDGDEDYKTKYQAYLNLVNKNKPFAEHTEWLVALENTLKMARLIGEKTIVIGQSTGGLLAALSAVEYSDLVDQIVLVEPALRVNKLMDNGACLSRHLPDAVINFGSKILGVHVPDGTSVQMGCEVQKLADKYFPRTYVTTKDSVEERTVQVEDFTSLVEFAKKIKHPVLMINNENDKIVSSEANRWFFKGLSGVKEYTSINTDGQIPHGVITGFPFPGFVAQRLFEFYYFNYPSTLMAKEFLKTVESDIESIDGNYYSIIGPRCLQYAKPSYCEKNLYVVENGTKNIVMRVCRLLTAEKCDVFKKNAEAIENYWKAYLQRAVFYGKDSAEKSIKETSPPKDYLDAKSYFSEFRESLSEKIRALSLRPIQ
jgi:alpha-beta hydrolase superfamily lysophospholipase